MTLQTTGTVENGVVRVDVPIDLPDKTQVQITIVPQETIESERQAAWDSLVRRLEENPIHGGGRKFHRDELYDRH